MAGKTIGSLMVRLGLDAKDVDKGLKAFERNLKTTAKNMESIGTKMSIGFTAPFLLAMRQSIKAYQEEAQAVKKLEVALGGTSTALLKQAAAIQKTTIYADDAVIGVQAWAAALGHGEEEIGKMTTAAVGLAAGLGIGLDQAMSMLHKTTLGVAGGLGKTVPGIKDMTKEQLKAGAAIDLVTQKFSGYAEEMGNLDPLTKFQNRFGDLMEQFGEQALPLLNKIIEKFEKLTDWFSKLSPETKKMVVEVGAFVALAGPALILAGNITKLAVSLKLLEVNLKSLGTGAVKGGLAVLASMGIGEGLQSIQGVQGDEDYQARLAAMRKGSAKIYSGQGSASDKNAHMLGGISMAMGQLFTGNFGKAKEILDITSGRDQLGGRASRGGGLSGYLGKIEGKDDIIIDPTPKAEKVVQDLVKASEWIKSGNFSGPRGTEGLLDAFANVGAGFTKGAIEDGPDGVSMAGFGSGASAFRVPEGFGGEGMVSEHGEQVKMLNEGYLELGNTIASVMSSVAESLLEGGNAWAAFGKAALLAGAQTVKAMLAASLAKAIANEAGKTGVAGIIIGATLGMAAIGVVEGMIGKMKVPKLAMGGGAGNGPMLAMLGDNPSGKEMALPWERTNEFAGKIASQMGGGGGAMQLVVRGDDLLYATSRAQYKGQRRGSSNLIIF